MKFILNSSLSLAKGIGRFVRASLVSIAAYYNVYWGIYSLFWEFRLINDKNNFGG